MDRNDSELEAATSADATLAPTEELGRELHGVLVPLMEALGGSPPRPGRIIEATGIDKTLASRLVRACRSRSDLEFIHLVPAPAGLRILADRVATATHDHEREITKLRELADRFGALIAQTPGGRAALDARIAETMDVARERGEHTAKQASFKAMSYLLGYFSDLFSSTLFLVPSASGRRVDGIEVQRRIGLHRMRPSAPLPLFGYAARPEGEPTEDPSYFDAIDGTHRKLAAGDLILPGFSSQPLPPLDIVQEGVLTTLLLPKAPTLNAIERITWAFRMRNGGELDPGPGLHALSGYIHRMPCRTMVRDLYIAEDVYPGATPRIGFHLPGPRPSGPAPETALERHFSSVDIEATVEPLPPWDKFRRIPGLADQPALLHHVLERAGCAGMRFRGWRCTLTYPVPLVEIVWWLDHPA